MVLTNSDFYRSPSHLLSQTLIVFFFSFLFQCSNIDLFNVGDTRSKAALENQIFRCLIGAEPLICPPPRATKPVFSSNPGFYNTLQKIAITSDTSNSTIYFSIEGSTPTESSIRYSSALSVWTISGNKIQAIATRTGLRESEILSGEFSYPPLKTGQTTVYATGDNGSNQLGLDLSVSDPIQHAAYTSDFITEDRATGLIWKSCSEGLTGNTCTGSVLTRNYDDAQAQCKALNNENVGNGYAGIKTWRLPSRFELETLVDHSRTAVPVINVSGFPNTISGNYWSSTTYSIDTSQAWNITFSSGVMSINPKSDLLNIRCVSSSLEKKLFQNFTDNGDGTIKDNGTNLVWQKCTIGQNNDTSCSGTESTLLWSQAITSCNSLSLAGRTWRLPSINELKTIIDTSLSVAPTINGNFFPGTIVGTYWSSTTYALSTTSAWQVPFGTGAMFAASKSSNSLRVRCVSGL